MNDSTPSGSATSSPSSSRADAGDLTLVDVLQAFADVGYSANHGVRPNAELHCDVCASVSPAELVEVSALHRVEGASNPAEMQMVIGSSCPRCAARGALVVGFGPEASDDDQTFVMALPLDHSERRFRDPVAERS
ncbi:MAG: hypothetical protein ACE37B_06425 [Ilumatobacter sp.]|jgi:ferredoxin|uniref:hypothetical protein n=1 Tax=Ilumatobacter sp. TaxID=1967498 RepID=UPI00391A94C2